MKDLINRMETCAFTRREQDWFPKLHQDAYKVPLDIRTGYLFFLYIVLRAKDDSAKILTNTMPHEQAACKTVGLD